MGVKPKALEERPELDFRQQWYYTAYQSISRSRSVGMGGPLPVPVSEILAYCQLFYIAKLNERERLFRYINSLDNAYLDYVGEQSKSKSAK